jgi:hypothetical protein
MEMFFVAQLLSLFVATEREKEEYIFTIGIQGSIRLIV